MDTHSYVEVARVVAPSSVDQTGEAVHAGEATFHTLSRAVNQEVVVEEVLH